MNDETQNLPATLDNGFGEAMEGSLAVGLARAEIDTQIATARRFPRQHSQVSTRILSLATLDEETAEESMYALPRGGKPIQGPSIRFAEIVKTSYGNCRAAARVVHVDRVEKVVIAEGVFHDLETNTATRAEVRRRIVNNRGALYNDDMIIVTGNAACSIALRNAILGGVPKALWRKAYDAVLGTIAGDVRTLSVTRDKAVKALANFGVKPEQVFVALGVGGEEDITLGHIPTLRGMFAALKNGEATVEEMFRGTVTTAGGHDRVANPLRDESPKDGDGKTVQHDDKTGEVDEKQGGQPAKNDPAGDDIGRNGETDYDADRQEGGQNGQKATSQASGEAEGAKPATAPKTAPAATAAKQGGPRTSWDGEEEYVEWFRDVIDKARSASAIRDEWSRTREDRKELLSGEALDALEKEKNAAVDRLKAGA